MPKINKSQFAILGCLSTRPMSVYEIKQFIAKTIAHFWTEREGQLYPTIRKLNEQGFVSFHEEDAQKSGKKKIYTITEQGKNIFSDWLSDRADQAVYRNELLLKTFFGSFQSIEKSITVISTFLDESKELLNLLKSIKSNMEKRCLDPKRRIFINLCFDYGIDVLSSEITWCKRSIDILKKAG